MTAEMMTAVLESSHASGVVSDGDEFRVMCICGWLSTSMPSLSEAHRTHCGAEIEQQRGKARLARYLERHQAG